MTYYLSVKTMFEGNEAFAHRLYKSRAEAMAKAREYAADPDTAAVIVADTTGVEWSYERPD